MHRTLTVLRARRWLPLSLAALRNTTGSSTAASSCFSVRAGPPSTSSYTSDSPPTPNEANSTKLTFNKKKKDAQPENNNDMDAAAASDVPPREQQQPSAVKSSSSNTTKDDPSQQSPPSNDDNASSTTSPAAMTIGGISYQDVQRALRDREFATHLLQNRIWKEEYAIYLLCLVCFCLVYYSASSSVRHTQRRCQMLEQRTKEELELLHTTLTTTLDRWTKDLVLRDEKIMEVYEKNKQLTSSVEQMTTAIKSCTVPTPIR